MGLPGPIELAIIAGVFVLMFGASRLPNIMRSMGRSVNEFKQGLKDEPLQMKNLEDKDASEEAAEQAAS